jgi:hypothetical protein
MSIRQSRLSKSYRATFTLWGRYWTLYGGGKALFSSIYFLLAVVFTALNYWAWSKPHWWDVVISTIPTLLGFTLAGLAVFLSMDSGFSRSIAGKSARKKASPFMALVTSFVHFIVIQVFAFVYALTAKSFYIRVDGLPEIYYRLLPIFNLIGGALGYFLFLYAIFLVLGATFAIFRSSTWYEMYIDAVKTAEKEKAQNDDSNGNN